MLFSVWGVVVAREGCPAGGSALVRVLPELQCVRRRGPGMKANAGDVLIVESERLTQPMRRGVIEEVMREKPPCFRVRWDDGHTSIFTPAAGSARVEERKRSRRA
jgi:Domain of unknown function (DUF1918)